MDIAKLRHIFATRIRKLREGKLNQGEFADSVGISRGAMSYYEQESRTPDIGVLYSICKKYNISADYLLGLIPDRNHRVSDICHETALSPKAAQMLNYIARIVRSDAFDDVRKLTEEEGASISDSDLADMMKAMVFTSLPELLNILLENDEGLDLLNLLSAIILGAEFVGEGEVPPHLIIKSAVKDIQVAFPIENITAALWVNIQSEADKLKEKYRGESPPSE